MIQPIDYGGMMTRQMAGLPDYLEQNQQRAMIGQAQAQTALAHASVAAKEQEQQRLSGLSGAWEGFQKNPTAQSYSQLLGQYPEFGKEIGDAWKAMDESTRRVAQTKLGEMGALIRTDPNKALSYINEEIEADRKAGIEPDEQDLYIQEQLQSGTPEGRNRAAAITAATIGASDPQHAKSYLESLGLSQEPDLIAVAPGAEVLGRNNPSAGPVYTSAYRPQTFTDPTTGQQMMLVPDTGTPAGTPQDSVATTLAAGGLPAPVVAGFLGNFDVEGGYGGAKGDGGSAHGIAQWRNERAANFERIIGKPVAQANHAEQAKYVLWEMENPQAAGMTVPQRDAIMAAKTPQQAAALIDKFYERSSGEHRQRRVGAAGKYAGGPTQVRSKQQYDRLPKGAQYIAPDGSVRTKG